MDYENAKAERDFRMNPPENAPMQGGGDDWDNMLTGSSSVENIADSYQSNINETLNNPQNGFNNGQPQNPNMPAPRREAEDIFFDSLAIGGKGIIAFVKALVKSIQNNKAGDWHRLGVRCTKVSAWVILIGLIFCIWEMFAQNGNTPEEIMLGGLISLAVGLTLSFKFEADDTEVEEATPETPVEDSPNLDDWSIDNNDEGYSFDEDDGFSEDDSDVDMDAWLNVGSDDGLMDEALSDNCIASENFNADETVNTLPEITVGTQTRQYLFECFTKVLPYVNAGYAEMKDLSPDSEMFYIFEEYLRSAAIQLNMKEESIPELLSLKENPFVYRMNCTRPAGMKEQAIADEIASAYCHNENNEKIYSGVYATIVTSPGLCSINVFKGFKEINGKQVGGAMISLADVYNQIKDFMLDSQIEYPFVWGVNEMGKSLYCDMKDNNSIIICGEPRGGKSWKGQSIVAQLAMFHSPKEVEFYILDNKNSASDYRYLSDKLPHVRYFCGDPDKINDSLDKIYEMALATTGAKLDETGFISIKDYNKANPNDKLPYRYIVIDELQGLMDYFEKTDQKEQSKVFRGHLSTIVSKLAFLGIRMVLFPHRIVDQIISKNTYSLVSCRAVVNQLDAKQVEASIGVTESKFGYKLAQVGDMGIRLHEINGGEACYCHAEILSKDNKTNEKLFDYIGAVWRKLEPDVECIEMRKSGKFYMGGEIVIPRVNARKAVESIPIVPKDNTSGKSEYSYGGFSSGQSVGSVVNDDDDISLEVSKDVDESFWDEF